MFFFLLLLLFFLENKIQHSKQIVSLEDNLHEVSDPIFQKKYEKILSLLPAEFAHTMVSVDSEKPSKILLGPVVQS